MTVHYDDDAVTLHHGDCLEVMATLPDASVDAIVTDPPYGLGFMGKAWDDLPPGEPWARECLRVLKPGGHLLAFGGTRTWHRLAVAVEDAGFEVRDSIAWLYGSGFPKSLNVATAVDTHVRYGGSSQKQQRQRDMGDAYEPHPLAGTPGFGDGNLRKGADGNTQGRKADVTSTEGQQWSGWGTALKPAFEPIVVARKPLVGTVAATVLQYGTGAINVDGCRINPGTPVAGGGGYAAHKVEATEGWDRPYINGVSKTEGHTAGRWPTNVVLDGSQADALDEQSGTLKSGANPTRRSSDKFRDAYGDFKGQEECTPARGADEGGASRFFPTFRYQAKAPTRERVKVADVAHPTVKPLELMRWLVRLVTPPGGLVLEPFAGSGTTVEAAVLEGFQCLAIEREADYLPLILARLERHKTTDEGLPVMADDLALFDMDGDAA